MQPCDEAIRAIRMEMDKGARKIIEICAGLKAGEHVLIITDDGRPRSVSEALANAATASNGKVTVIFTSAEEISGKGPNRIIAAAMKHADVIFAPTSRTLGHSSPLTEALKKGARALLLTECTEQTLISGAIEADFMALKPLVDFVEKKLNGADRVHVRASGGTDIWLNIHGRKAATCSGICHKPGDMIGIPDVEVYIAPIEEKTEGEIVIDASCSYLGLVKDPITIKVEKGMSKSIIGGKEAEELRSILAATGDQASYVISEFAVGLNPKGMVRGNIIEDEGVYGTGHFALGNNIAFGGRNKAPIHFDMVYWQPTIELDGKHFIKEGRLCCFDETQSGFLKQLTENLEERR